MRPLLTAFLFLGISYHVMSQAASSAPWPQWVTNDYTCVIGCLQSTFSSATPPATNDQKNQAIGCVTSTCSPDTAQGNIYQATYIIAMWDQYGTLYEPQSWIDNGGPITTQAAAAIDPQDADPNANSEGDSGQNSTPTTMTMTGEDGSTTTSIYIDTKVYPGSYPTGTDGLRSLVYTSTVVNHGFSTSSIKLQPSVSGNASAHNGTSSGGDRVVSDHGSWIGLAGSLVIVLGSVVGGSFVLI